MPLQLAMLFLCCSLLTLLLLKPRTWICFKLFHQTCVTSLSNTPSFSQHPMTSDLTDHMTTTFTYFPILPINTKSYRYPHFQKEAMIKLIVDMLQEGLIWPSTSPYSSPILLVKRNDEICLFCVDYRALNAITIRDRFPIPTINELLDELHGVSYFSKIDLWSGYHQIRLAQEYIPKTGFCTIDGHY